MRLSPVTMLFAFALAFALVPGLGCHKDQQPAAGQKPASSAADTKNAAAIVNGKAITFAQLDEATKRQMRALDLERFQIRQQVLMNMVANKLVEDEAARRKVTPEELIKQEIEAKTPPPTRAQVEEFYRQNAERIGRPLPEIGNQLAQDLHRQSLQYAYINFVRGLKEKSQVQSFLYPDPIPVEAKGPAKGPADAPVTLVLFSDFQCPYCSQTGRVLDEILKTYGPKVRLVFRDYPLPSHPLALKAAEAAHCAEAQGKFWEFHDHLFANQAKLAPADLKAAARTLGLDGAKFDACLDGGSMTAIVTGNAKSGEDLGVAATPTLFVNGRLIPGVPELTDLKGLIDNELRGK